MKFAQVENKTVLKTKFSYPEDGPAEFHDGGLLARSKFRYRSLQY